MLEIFDNFQFIVCFPCTKGTSLILCDDIQEAPNVLHALKYFNENGKALDVGKQKKEIKLENSPLYV